MTQATTVVLWDIDGTLVTTASAGRRAVDRAFLELHGFEDATRGVEMAGRTDPAIVADTFRAHGVDPSPERRRGVLERYLEHLERELRAEPPPGKPFGPLPGVVAALEALASTRGCLQGLLTGNVVGGAKAKLERFDLWRFFSFGAFGDDSEERTKLLPFALARAEERHPGNRFEAAATIVLGDTPHDVAAGRAHGARTLAVATGGGFARAELTLCEPDHVFDDLSDTEAVLTALLGARACGEGRERRAAARRRP